MKQFTSYSIWILLSVFCLSACHYPGYYEKSVRIKNLQWPSSQRATFDFDIQDTGSTYNIYIVFRHLDAYHYNNVWMDITTMAPKDTAITQKLNLKLGDNKKWLGSIADDIVDHRILITRNPITLRAGHYTFILHNAMREDPLLNVLNVGIRVAKATN